MKKIVSICFLLCICFFAKAQLGTYVTDAKNYNNANIVTNGTQQITAVKVNTAFDKTLKAIGYIDTARRFLQFNPIAGTDVIITGTYPNITFSHGSTLKLLGFIIKDTNFTTIANYSSTGTSPTIVSNKIRLTSTVNNYTAKSAYLYNSLLERWHQNIAFKINTKITDGGIGIGMSSANTLDPANAIASIKQTSSITTIFIHSGYGIVKLDSLNIPNTSFQTNDSCVLEFDRCVDTLRLYFKNFTQNTQYGLISNITNAIAPNTGKFSIYNLGGTFDIATHIVSSNEVVNADVMMIGDSKTVGFGSGISSGRIRYGELLNNNFQTVIISGGGADKTTEVLLRINEILSLKPKQVILSIGCNDIRGGLSEATYESNYNNITNTLTAAGIRVLHEYYYEGSETFQPTQVAFLKSTYPNTYINTYDALKNYSGSIASSHPTDAGHNIIYKTTIESYKLLGGLNKSLPAYKLPQSFTYNNTIDFKNNLLWLKTPFKASEDTFRVGQVIIGDDTTVKSFVLPPSGIDHQKNSALIISKTKQNNNQNVDLLGMTTSDAPGKNGWSFLNYTNSPGIVQPRLETYALGGRGYEHFAYTKNEGFFFTTYNYDSLNLSGRSTDSILGTNRIFSIANSTSHFNMLGNGNLGLGRANITPTATLHVNGSVRLQGLGEAAGKVLTTDASGNATWQTATGGGSISLATIGASPNSNGATLAGSVFNLEPASASFGGVVTTNSQTFAGAKTFNNDLTVNGITAGRGPGNISNNTVLGNFTVSATNVGAGNTIMGNSGFFINNTTGGGNTVVGFNTSVSNTTGNGNTVMGSNAGSFISTGSNNTIIGSGTGGLQLSTGSNNTLIGNLNATGNSLGNPSNNIILSDGAGNFRLRFDNTGRGTLTGNDLRYAANYAANYTSRSLTDLNALDSITSKKIKDSATTIITTKGIEKTFSATGDTLYLKDYCKTVTTASGATITPNSDTTNMYTVTALAVNTTFAAPVGTPEDGRSLLIRIKDDATSRTLTWNAIYRASTDFALPTTTTVSKTMYVQFIYNSADSKWDAIGLTKGF